MRLVFYIALILSLLIVHVVEVYGQEIGGALPKWEKGFLDIHHINTGKGDAAFFILPDGTTMLVDAGDQNRPPGPRELDIIPNPKKFPGEWIARYINKMMSGENPRINYTLLTHFHSDHMGGMQLSPRNSKNKEYYVSGITEVAEFIPLDKIIDRAWPDYDWPLLLENKDILNYKKFLLWQKNENNVIVEKFSTGVNDQIILVNDPGDYPNFEIRNVAANGIVWTGVNNNVRNQFPLIETLDRRDYPSENMCSLAVRLSYGKFDYYTGGDLPGLPFPGSPVWMDIESPVGLVVGPVEVHVVNHHGFMDAANENFVRSLGPQVHIIQSWVVSQPSPSTLARMLSTRLYPGARDIFATNITDTNRTLIGASANKIKGNGHIVIRVLPDGESYFVYILDAMGEDYNIKEIFGPYYSK